MEDEKKKEDEEDDDAVETRREMFERTVNTLLLPSFGGWRWAEGVGGAR